MGTDNNTVSASNTKIMIYGQFFTGSVHTVFNRTTCDTGITIDTFYFIDLNNWSERSLSH
jgi:hypothetical protein